mmetsp:Transcript_73095/g.174309  ORF Transcript_73095/g.174309 Transcript_73095/m.174309 type:complete len:237 (-) Transcript_73095:258-968(-)
MGPENCAKVLKEALIVADGSTRMRSCLLAKLNRRESQGRQPAVKDEKSTQQGTHDDRQSHPKDESESGSRIHLVLTGPDQTRRHSGYNEPTAQGSVENQKEEVLVVPESYAIRNPRAVVVHAEDARVADPAVMTSIWLVLDALLAEAALASLLLHLIAPRLRLAGGRALPVCLGQPFLCVWHRSRICKDSPPETDHHEHDHGLRENGLDHAGRPHPFVYLFHAQLEQSQEVEPHIG